jgi:peptidoglycan-N-acetylglucosamine deacetylase
MKEIQVGFGIDIDAVSGWLGSFGGEKSFQAMSRGLFAGEVGIPRILKLLDRHAITATWFAPGHSIETFPRELEQIVTAGHEIGAHGYSHEEPSSMSPEQEEDVLVRSIELIEKVSGTRPSGYTAPWWDPSPATMGLLRKYGFKYDHSLMHRDFEPYFVREGDSWTSIDLSKSAAEWMKPLVRGNETRIVEIPGSWYLDDLPPMMFVPSSPNSHGWVNPWDILQQWKDQLEWVCDELDYAIFPIAIHPDVSGRPQVLKMLEQFISFANGLDGVRWCSYGEMADDFLNRSTAHGTSVSSEGGRVS